MNNAEMDRDLLALSMLKGVGHATLKKIAELSIHNNQRPLEAAVFFKGIEKSLNEKFSWDIALEAAHKQLDSAENINAFIIGMHDPRYPELLKETSDAPYFIYVLGSLHSSPIHSVAVIGTREPTGHGEIITERIASFYSEKSWSVVSGLALGCDAIAHKAAIKSGGHTVAVMAHGLHMVAPAKNKKLADEILSSGGALISEYGFGINPAKQYFVKRDRIQAGLSQGVVMIQSDLRGGSLHASRAALDYGRWLATPYPTKKDYFSNEPKVQANLLLASSSESEKMTLLKTDKEGIKRVKILYSKEDYDSILSVGSVKKSSYDQKSML